MKKLLFIPILALLLTLTSCGFAGEPMLDDAYPRDVYFTEGYRIILEGDSKILLEFRPDLDPTKLAVNAKPTMIERGICIGYSLPIGGADEELFYNICVPDRWDGISDIYVHIHAWLDTAQDDANDAVRLQLSWRQATVGEVVPAAFHTLPDEVVTGVVAQFTAIEFSFTIDYDIIPADHIETDDTIFFRLVRADAAQEIDGEPVIYHASVIFQCDKFGATVP